MDEIKKYISWIQDKKSGFEMKESKILHRGGLTFRITADFPGIDDFYQKRFTPYYADTDGEGEQNFDIRVLKIEDYHSLPAQLGEKFYIIENKKDSRKNIAAHRYLTDTVSLFVIERTGNTIYINDRNIILLGDNEASLLNDLRIIIKDISNAYLIKKGFVEMHASAVARGDELFICSGKSNRGKSSLLFHFLGKKEYDLVSNGRMYVKVEDGKLFGIGTPESIYIRPHSFHKHPELRKMKIIEGGLFFSLETGGEDKKCRVNYIDIAKAFGCSIRSQGEVATVFLPYLDIDNRKYESDLKKLVSGEEHFFSYDNIKRRFWTNVVAVSENEYEKNLEAVFEYIDTIQEKKVVLRKGEDYYINGELKI